MGSEEYSKLRHACQCLVKLHERDQDIWNRTHNEKATNFFKSAELQSTGKKLAECIKLLNLKEHNYRMLERI